MKLPIRELCPPVVLNAIRAMLRRREPSTVAALAKISRGIIFSDSHYRVEFKRVEAGSEIYFVPAYAIHRPACKELLAGRYYEPTTHALIAALLKERPGNLIHAGTFFGDMLPSFSKKCPGVVYAFEPVLENYLLAKLCVQANNLSNVFLWNAALGRRLSVAHIDTGQQTGIHRGGSSQIGSVGQITSIFPIDALGLENISVIQLDVEGFEVDALTGATRTINLCRPTILVEDNNQNCGPLLSALGYEKIGDVPELTLWAAAKDSSKYKSILRELLGGRRQS